MTPDELEEWLAIRKKAGLEIDPKTAEVDWWFACVPDPYGVGPELPDEMKCVSLYYFARSPGSDIWVWFDDLPPATADALWEKHKADLAYPEDLPIKEMALLELLDEGPLKTIEWQELAI